MRDWLMGTPRVCGFEPAAAGVRHACVRVSEDSASRTGVRDAARATMPATISVAIARGRADLAGIVEVDDRDRRELRVGRIKKHDRRRSSPSR